MPSEGSRGTPPSLLVVTRGLSADTLDAVAAFYDDVLTSGTGTWSSPERGVKQADSAYWSVKNADGTLDAGVNAQRDGERITINITVLRSDTP